MTKHLPIIETTANTSRTLESWKNGGLRYDHSNDAELAAAGDEDAKKRLRTKQALAVQQLAGRIDTM